MKREKEKRNSSELPLLLMHANPFKLSLDHIHLRSNLQFECQVPLVVQEERLNRKPIISNPSINHYYQPSVAVTRVGSLKKKIAIKSDVLQSRAAIVFVATFRIRFGMVRRKKERKKQR